MSKQEAFKRFVSKNPELAIQVKEKKRTWQEFYELFDLYGENNSVWDEYKKSTRALPIGELAGLVKNINMDNVGKYITNAQKAINVIQELTTKAPTKNIPVPKSPRPITKFFGD